MVDTARVTANSPVTNEFGQTLIQSYALLTASGACTRAELIVIIASLLTMAVNRDDQQPLEATQKHLREKLNDVIHAAAIRGTAYEFTDAILKPEN